MKGLFKGDKSIYAVLVTLSLISLVGVLSTYGRSTGVWSHLFKQIVFLIVGLFVFILFEKINYRSKFFKLIITIGYIISIVTLLLLPVVGVKGGGAARTINLGFMSFQPIEVAKVFSVITAASLCSKHIDSINESWKGWFMYLVLPMGLIVAPILPQNLSSVLLIAFPVFIILLMSNIKRKYILALCCMAVVAFGVYLAFKGNRADTWHSRLSMFMGNGGEIDVRDPRTAIGHGGLFGTFPGRGTVKLILDNVESDYIYSILVEEGGMILGAFIMIMYLILLFRMIRIVLKTEDLFGKLMVAGIGLLISFQAYVHMMVAVGLIPVTGQQLPFVSKGGSSLLVLCMAVGITQNIYIRNKEIDFSNGKN